MVDGLANDPAGKQADLGLIGKADVAAMRGGESDDKALVAKAVFDAAAFVALTDAATVAVDLSAGFNFTWLLPNHELFAR